MYTNLIIWQVVRLSLNRMTSENSLVVDGGSGEWGVATEITRRFPPHVFQSRQGAGGEKDASVQTL